MSVLIELEDCVAKVPRSVSKAINLKDLGDTSSPSPSDEYMDRLPYVQSEQ
jgi:hypothetical protein